MFKIRENKNELNFDKNRESQNLNLINLQFYIPFKTHILGTQNFEKLRITIILL